LNEDSVLVSLANPPVHKPANDERRFPVPLADIEDWVLIDSAGVMEGGFTHVALAHAYKRDKGFVPHAMHKELAAFKDLDLSGI